jgi:hypothetical protein
MIYTLHDGIGGENSHTGIIHLSILFVNKKIVCRYCKIVGAGYNEGKRGDGYVFPGVCGDYQYL